MVNLTSNVTALAVYLAHGQVLFGVGIPAAVCGILGSFLGSTLAVRRGAKFIRPVLIGAVALLFAKLLWDFIPALFS